MRTHRWSLLIALTLLGCAHIERAPAVPFDLKISVDSGMYGRLYLGQPIRLYLDIINTSGEKQTVLQPLLGMYAQAWGSRPEDWKEGGGHVLEVRSAGGQWRLCFTNDDNRSSSAGWLPPQPPRKSAVLGSYDVIHIQIDRYYGCYISAPGTYQARITEYFPPVPAPDYWTGTIQSPTISFTIHSLDAENQKALSDLKKLDTYIFSIFQEENLNLCCRALEFIKNHPTSWYAGELLSRSLIKDPVWWTEIVDPNPSAESLAVSRDIIHVFQDFLAAHPDVPWASDGWLRVAATATYTKDFALVSDTLKKIISKWPNSEAASQAKTLMAYFTQRGILPVQH